MARHQVVVPDIGGAEGAEVIELLVAVGDEVDLEQGLLVLESDKASMEIPATAAGKVVEILVSEGQQLSEGEPIAVLEAADDTSDAGAESPGSSGQPAGGDEAAASKADVEGGGDRGETGGEAASQHDKGAAETAAKQEPAAGAREEMEVPVPDIGTDDAVELIEICVAEGDEVAEGDSLVVLESDKASMEVPSPAAGTVLKMQVSEGDSVRQGDALLLLATTAAGSPEAPESKASEKPDEADRKEASPGPQEHKPRATGEAAAAPPPASPEALTPAPAPLPEAGSGAGKVYAGPAVRKLAREFGIDLSQVRGSGPRGRLVKEDLHQFVQRALQGKSEAALSGAGIPAVPEQDFSAFGPVEIQPRSKLEKLTASNMARSWLNVPHVTQTDRADITELEAFRADLKSEAEARGTRLTPLPFLLKACAIALRDHPKFRSSLVEGGESLALKDYIHVGMAVDTPAGLMVPVIRDVDRKSLWDLAEEVLDLAARARDRKLSPKEMQGGCFTISSLGGIGGTSFTPIVNTPEVGILGVSRADWQPVWNGTAFEPRKLLPLSLSYDHRVINGGDAGRFLTQLVTLLGDIRRLLL